MGGWGGGGRPPINKNKQAAAAAISWSLPTTSVTGQWTYTTTLYKGTAIAISTSGNAVGVS